MVYPSSMTYVFFTFCHMVLYIFFRFLFSISITAFLSLWSLPGSSLSYIRLLPLPECSADLIYSCCFFTRKPMRLASHGLLAIIQERQENVCKRRALDDVCFRMYIPSLFWPDWTESQQFVFDRFRGEIAEPILVPVAELGPKNEVFLGPDLHQYKLYCNRY
jgi:hypothetical protein